MAPVLLLIVGLIIGSGGVYFIIYQPEINEYENKLSDLTSEVSDLTVAISEYENRRLDLTSEVSDLTLAISNLESEVTELESVNSDYESQVSQLKSDLSDAEGEIETLESRISTIQIRARDDYDQLQSQYDDLEYSYEELLDQYELAVASLPLSPEPLSGETIEMAYAWTYNGRQWTLSLSIPETVYNYYKEKERIVTTDYSIYVTHPYDDEYINTIIMKFNYIALERGYSEEEKINLIISFVQSLPYTSDSVTTPYDEYPRYPLETLVDNGGDCEDTSILVASLLKSMNYDVILIAPPGHMAVGVHLDYYGSYWEYNGKEYFFLETTNIGWEIGDIPEDYEGSSAYLYELKPIPLCTIDWIAAWKGSKLEIVLTANNEGTAIATNILVYIAFDAGEGMVWSPVESDPFDLNAGRSYTLTMLLDPPQNKHTRLILGVVDAEGYYMDKSYSTWFDT